MIAGIGFRTAATMDSVLDALERAGATDCRRLALPQDNLHHTAATALREAGYLLIPIAPHAMSAQSTLSESAASRAARGTGSVAEACALAAAGAGGRLAGARAISGDRMATAALAVTGDIP